MYVLVHYQCRELQFARRSNLMEAARKGKPRRNAPFEGFIDNYQERSCAAFLLFLHKGFVLWRTALFCINPFKTRAKFSILNSIQNLEQAPEEFIVICLAILYLPLGAMGLGQAINRVPDTIKTLQIGNDVTRGLGAGGMPDIGKRAAEESRADIAEARREATVL